MNVNVVLNQPAHPDDVHISDIEKLEVSTCLNINLGNVLDFLPYDARQHLLGVLAAKLRYGGVISLSGVDASEMGRLLFLGSINNTQLNEILYGGKQSICSIMDMLFMVEQTGLSIQQKQINDIQYHVRAIRHKPNSNNSH